MNHAARTSKSYLLVPGVLLGVFLCFQQEFQHKRALRAAAEAAELARETARVERATAPTTRETAPHARDRRSAQRHGQRPPTGFPNAPQAGARLVAR